MLALEHILIFEYKIKFEESSLLKFRFAANGPTKLISDQLRNMQAQADALCVQLLGRVDEPEQLE